MSAAPKPVALKLLTKPGCHLCDDARNVIDRVRDELSPRYSTSLEEVNILDEEYLVSMYSEDIPVLFVNGKQHAVWKVDETRLAAAIEKAARPGFFSQ